MHHSERPLPARSPTHARRAPSVVLALVTAALISCRAAFPSGVSPQNSTPELVAPLLSATPSSVSNSISTVSRVPPRVQTSPVVVPSPQPPLAQAVTTHVRIYGVSFADPDHGWLIGYGGCSGCPSVVRTTNDGGQTWLVLPDVSARTADDRNTNLDPVTFATRSDGWIYGNRLLATHDGGLTWLDETPPGQTVIDLQAKQGVAWRLDQTGTCPSVATTCTWILQLSSDGGRRWQRSPTQPPLTISDRAPQLAVRSPSEAWLYTWSDLPPHADLVVTHDAGVSWQERPHPCTEPAFVGSQTLAPSLDGQELWLICGGQPSAGQQPKRLFASADDGRHWTEPGKVTWGGYVGPLVALSAERAFWGESRGGGVVLGTRDGGRTWQPEIREPESLDLLRAPIPFVDARHGWIVGPYAVWRTTDGGDAWQRNVP
jgi:photosystem II stability/assembly factor-like uncharacterized protein